MTTTAPAAPVRKQVEPGAEPPPPERSSVSRWIPAAVVIGLLTGGPALVHAIANAYA